MAAEEKVTVTKTTAPSTKSSNSIASFVSTTWTSIRTHTSNFFGSVKTGTISFVGSVASFTSSVASKVKSAFTKTWSWFTGLWKSMKSDKGETKEVEVKVTETNNKGDKVQETVKEKVAATPNDDGTTKVRVTEQKTGEVEAGGSKDKAEATKTTEATVKPAVPPPPAPAPVLTPGPAAA